MVFKPNNQRSTNPAELWRGRLGAAHVLAGMFVVSCAARIVLVGKVQTPWTFPDELVYEQLAISIGRAGHLALYNRSGLSFPPLYSATLAPLFALGLSASRAYEAIKIVNAILMSLSLFPVYGIARFLLPRRPALVVVLLSAAAPLMYYTSLVMSENLAYPLFLVSVWLLLRTMLTPTRWNDGLLLAAIVLTCAARIQFLVLLPAALTALLLAGVFGRDLRRPRLRGMMRDFFRDHAVLAAGYAALALVAAAVALSGGGTFSLAGSYSSVPNQARPNLVQLARLIADHAGGLVFAVGVIPWIGTLVAAYVCLRWGAGRRGVAFAAAGVALTGWLLVETAFATFGIEKAGDTPRIHERYLFYLVPLFLVALVVALRDRRALPSPIPHVLATLIAALAVLTIPFKTVITSNIVADSFSLQIFARGSEFRPNSHASILAVSIVVELGALFIVFRSHTMAVAGVVLVAFVFMSVLLGIRIDTKAHGESLFVTPGAPDWVDRAHPASAVVLLTGPPGGYNPEIDQTDYFNLSIKGLYYTCRPTLSALFREQAISIGNDGTILANGLPLETDYAVVPSNFGVQGQVLAVDRIGGEVLVAVPTGVLRISRRELSRWVCPAGSTQ